MDELFGCAPVGWRMVDGGMVGLTAHLPQISLTNRSIDSQPNTAAALWLRHASMIQQAGADVQYLYNNEAERDS